MELIENNKCGLKLCLNSYMYIKKYTRKQRIRWECSAKRRFACRGALVTNLAITEILSTVEHSHISTSSDVEATKARNLIKTHSISTRSKPLQIIVDTLCNFSLEARSSIGHIDSIKRSIRNYKRINRPKDPTSLLDLIIIDRWQKTVDGKQFLLHDSGNFENNERIIIFASHFGLKYLSLADIWFLDGTFSVAPKLFKQLIIIRTEVECMGISCVYAFLTGKSQKLYEYLLKTILIKISREFPLKIKFTILVDFELSIINAIKIIFGNLVNIKCCFYHLTQCTWRKIQALGLTNAYKSNNIIRVFCGMIDALAFLPIDKVVSGINYLKQNIPVGCEEFVYYFDQTFVSGVFHFSNGILISKYPPLFEISLWNVNKATLNGEARTNNLCEGWNSSFRKTIGIDHPSIWVAIEGIQKDEMMVSSLLYRYENGIISKKRNCNYLINNNLKLKNACVEFNLNFLSIDNFLKIIGATIRF